MKIRDGYHQTEVGVIPRDWKAKKIDEIAHLTNGFAFSSDFFSDNGAILLTPGNFKLDGGVKFNTNNTKRYCGPFDESKVLRNGELVIVMTDLTADCNLLGKPAFVQNNELVLLNQRIAKVTFKGNEVDSQFLFYLLLSERYLSQIKSYATGSTVRHTSTKIIGNTPLPVPPVTEQKAIAAVLSDIDALLTTQQTTIAKKCDLKTAAMQQLLGAKYRLPGFSGDWETKRIGELGRIIRGASPRPQGDPRYYGGSIPRLMVEDVTRDGKYVTPSVDFLTLEGAKRSRPCQKGTLTIVCSGTVGVTSILAVDACIHDGFLALVDLPQTLSVDFLFHQLSSLRAKFDSSATHGGIFTNLTTKGVADFEIQLPSTLAEQQAIAAVLSDMDAEIAQLEATHRKTRDLKAGAMQQLLTGAIRLV